MSKPTTIKHLGVKLTISGTSTHRARFEFRMAGERYTGICESAAVAERVGKAYITKLTKAAQKAA